MGGLLTLKESSIRLKETEETFGPRSSSVSSRFRRCFGFGSILLISHKHLSVFVCAA